MPKQGAILKILGQSCAGSANEVDREMFTFFVTCHRTGSRIFGRELPLPPIEPWRRSPRSSRRVFAVHYFYAAHVDKPGISPVTANAGWHTEPWRQRPDKTKLGAGSPSTVPRRDNSHGRTAPTARRRSGLW